MTPTGWKPRIRASLTVPISGCLLKGRERVFSSHRRPRFLGRDQRHISAAAQPQNAGPKPYQLEDPTSRDSVSTYVPSTQNKAQLLYMLYKEVKVLVSMRGCFLERRLPQPYTQPEDSNLKPPKNQPTNSSRKSPAHPCYLLQKHRGIMPIRRKTHSLNAIYVRCFSMSLFLVAHIHPQ